MNKTVSINKLIEEITDIVKTFPGESIVELFNQVSNSNVATYIGDDLVEITKTPTFTEDDLPF